jgi:hypothetical protein
MQTDLSTFAKPTHVRHIERVQQRAADALDDDLEQLDLSEVVQ